MFRTNYLAKRTKEEEDESPPVLPSTTPTQQKPPKSFRTKRIMLICVSYLLFRMSLDASTFLDWRARPTTDPCPQVDALTPHAKNGLLWDEVGTTIGTDPAFRARAVEWLAAAVRVPTESYDIMGPIGEDPRWEIFGSFHDYLLGAFPQVHASLQLTKVNTYGLLYTWVGSDPSLKPVLLAAHQDVVPVDPTTENRWAHPPYSGYFDGERIWGRGSKDDKSGLIGILSSVETLLSKNFQPARTFVLAFGFDEEVSGTRGAGQLAQVLLDIHGEDAFAFIIDEGGGFTEQHGSIFASPGIAEKGYMDVRVQVNTAGGHSSIPPRHTSIGILSSLLVEIEKNPYKAHLTRDDPLYSTLQCYAKYGTSIPSSLRKAIQRSRYSKKALHVLGKRILADPAARSLVGTTQAIDLIQGGVKTNALPEQAWAVINHRIAVSSSVRKTKDRDTTLLKSLASKFNLTYEAFGASISGEGDSSHTSSLGNLTLSDAFGHALEPAPVTPTGEDAHPYQLLSGTIKATYNSHRSLYGNDTQAIIVSPGMPTGNTDTRYYWQLSRHIFRYNHRDSTSAGYMGGVHTVNEFIIADSFLEIIRFFTTLILNADESEVL